MQNQIPQSNQAQNHTRMNNSFIGIQEKKLLLWMSARTPAWITPDILTMIGLFASVLIFISYALIGFIIQWYGDSMDGTLARYRKIERPRYGFFVDHIIDSVSEVLIFIGLGISPFLRFDIALLALISYLLASIYVFLTTYVNGVFRISYSGIGPTEMRLIGIAANTAVFFTSNPLVTFPWFSLSLFDLIVVCVILIIIWLFITNTISTAMSLSREDREAKRAKTKQERIARRQALQDKRALRKTTAQAARQSRIRVRIE
jgi:phosphatidylglycerophosphate synthase